ncbi:MAG TPA: dihydrodipicolinate synthase family protein [Terriglobia bacterium]|nr:dihydrodipicolinate synthase family protein [Terriglobia bacterium]
MDFSLNRREFLGSLAAAGAVGALAPTPAAALPPQPWRGVFIIMQTPYYESLKIDGESLKRETEFLVRCGVQGMVWPSGAGETNSISHDERVEFSRVIVNQARHRIPVLVGVHAPNKFEAAEYARQAEAMGADGMLARCQTDGTTDLDILTDYFTAITSASKLPLCIQVTTPATTVDYLIDLAHKLPTFRYVKEEVNPVHRVSEYVKRASGLLVPMTGGGAKMFMNEMARGSGGTMPGAGFADIQAQIWDWFQAGKRKQARELFAKMLMMAVMEEEVTYVLQKEILRRRGIFKNVLMRNTSKFAMDAGDQRELDAVFETLRPYFRV